jgi:hypothetical protein
MNPSLENCIAVIEQLKITNLRFYPTPEIAFEQGMVLATNFRCVSADERRYFLSLIDTDIGAKLISLSGVFAERAIDTSDTSFLEAAIIFHVIENFNGDFRMNTRHLVLIAYAADILKFHPANFLSSIINIATLKAFNWLNSYFNREPVQNELDLFNVEVIKVDGRTRFRQKKLPRFK